MRIAYIAAGAGGMYCGSCIHDNTLATALTKAGHEVALVPTYTPMRTDEENVSTSRVFYGALNVYLQQKSPLFRRTPKLFDRLLDRPKLLSWLMRFSASTDARELGELTLAVLQGEEGPQAKELDKLVTWLRDEYRPDLVQITNSMLLGLVRRFKSDLNIPVVVAVQGEDLFLDELPPEAQALVSEEMKRRAGEVDAFLAPSRYYAAEMSQRLGVPIERMEVVPLGIRVDGHPSPDSSETPDTRTTERPPTIGFLARIAPEKGLHLLVEAFELVAQDPRGQNARLRIAGYLGPKDREYFETQRRRWVEAGLDGQVEYVGELDLEQKAQFLDSIDVFTLPATYPEPKGLPVLEAMAHGVPAVQPEHGSFPEMLQATGGGLLVEPNSAAALAEGLLALLADPAQRRALGEAGRRTVVERFNEREMARATFEVYEKICRRHATGAASAS